MKEGNETNLECDVFTLANGFLVSNTDECSELIEKLLGDGTLWDFLSTLLNAYVQKKDIGYIMEQMYSVEELNKKQEDRLKALQENFQTDLAKVMSELVTLKSSLANGATVSSSVVATPIDEKPKTEPEVVKSRVKKSKGMPKIAGGFAAKAAKMGSMSRKDS